MTDQKNLDYFISENKITSDSERVANNPHMDSRDMDHYRVVLKRGKKRMTVFFSKGYGHGGVYPETNEVLNCLASDSASVENDSFESWCADLGYDSDSRKAERTYKACEKTAAKLKQFLGDDLYEELLWNTERM